MYLYIYLCIYMCIHIYIYIYIYHKIHNDTYKYMTNILKHAAGAMPAAAPQAAAGGDGDL